MLETNHSKYQEAFDAFAPALTLAEIEQRVAKILSERYEANNCAEVKKFLHSTIDLTTLTARDTEASVAESMTSRVRRISPASPPSASTPTSSRPCASC